MVPQDLLASQVNVVHYIIINLNCYEHYFKVSLVIMVFLAYLVSRAKQDKTVMNSLKKSIETNPSYVSFE